MQTEDLIKQEMARLKKQLVRAQMWVAVGQIVVLLALLFVLKYVVMV